MILRDLIAQLDEFCPPSFAESWDNPGLQAGRTDKEIGTVYIALDATSEVIEDAVRVGADLVLTHHPLLFGGIKHVTDTDFIGKRIVKLLTNDMACFAMHTNFDVSAMAAEAADRLRLIEPDVLDVTYQDSISHEGLGRIGELPEHMTLQECAVYVKENFGIPHVRYYGDPETPIVVTAIMPGSGKDEIDLALQKGADVMITGDITHHVGLDAVEKGIAVIDAGHYGVEKLFVPYMKEYLQREIPSLQVVTARDEEPFHEV
jgi:dinuclear metal center YbgI/SA1388 family protein